STSTVLFFAVATCVSLVSQIYHVSGTMSAFLITWIALTVPLVYIMRSSTVSLLVIALSTWHAALTGYGGEQRLPYEYGLTFLILLPHYYALSKYRNGNFYNVHSWFAAISFFIVIRTLTIDGPDNIRWLFTGYLAMAGCLYAAGRS